MGSQCFVGKLSVDAEMIREMSKRWCHGLIECKKGTHDRVKAKRVFRQSDVHITIWANLSQYMNWFHLKKSRKWIGHSYVYKVASVANKKRQFWKMLHRMDVRPQPPDIFALTSFEVLLRALWRTEDTQRFPSITISITLILVTMSGLLKYTMLNARKLFFMTASVAKRREPP